MFKSAVIKLTAWFVAALMLVCLLFSVPIYNVTSQRLKRGAERQTEVVRRLPDPFVPQSIVDQLERQREKQLIEDRHQLLVSLFFTNLVIIVSGAIASYLFARRTLKPIEEAHEAQVRFTSDASHELRTPLAVMQTEIEVALRNKSLTASDARQILTSNLDEVARLRGLSDQLLNLTRPQTELKLKNIKLDEFLTKQISALQKRHKTVIKSSLAKNIVAEADPTLLAQVLDILVKNAVTYSGKKEVEIKLAKAKMPNTGAIIKVIDHGKGINPLDLNKIFDRFYRGDNASKNNPNGHGLGLPLAKEIITRQGGEITAKSQPNKTTEFIINI